MSPCCTVNLVVHLWIAVCQHLYMHRNYKAFQKICIKWTISLRLCQLVISDPYLKFCWKKKARFFYTKWNLQWILADKSNSKSVFYLLTLFCNYQIHWLLWLLTELSIALSFSRVVYFTLFQSLPLSLSLDQYSGFSTPRKALTH